MIEVKLQIDGDVDAILKAEYRAGERAVTATMRTAAQGLKENWRGQVKSAGLGNRLANAIRSQAYPKGTDSLNAAALVWSKSPKIVGAHESGAVIRSANGFWLAIPVPAAGKGKRGGRITPIEWENRTGRRLRFVYWGGRIAKLVDDGTIAQRRITDDLSHTYARAGRGRRKKSRLMFILVPQVRLKKRLNLYAAANALSETLPAQIVARWRDRG